VSERFAHLAASLLRRQRRPAVDSLGDRAAALTVIEQALRRRARRRIWRRVSVAGAAAAAVVCLVVVSRAPAPRHASLAPHPSISASGHAAGPGATLWRAGTRTALAATVPLQAGDLLTGPGRGDLVMDLSTGSRLRVPERGEVELQSIGAVQRFGLRAGRLRADVAKLQAGQRFLVETGDAEIEVRGTSFEVSVEPRPRCASRSRTRVQVFEGVVTVRHGGQEVLVRAGSLWPADCVEPQIAPALSRAVRAPARRQRAVARVPAAVAVAVDETPALPSTLAEQNRLFAGALAAHRRGDDDAAVRFLDELVIRFPEGPLTVSALAERRKLQPGDRPAPR
jgi:hypothetical protein